MATDDGVKVLVTELRDGDLCDLADQRAKYGQAQVPDTNGRLLEIGDPSSARVQAVLHHLGHGQVIVITDQIAVRVPETELVRRLDQSTTPSD
ncbi:hypothetical protein [Gordonia sihwensis]|uniref:hypothetical protein n=1 Tax=Gordonia sihwensis TaxID=173559 RepID=UPI003D984624